MRSKLIVLSVFISLMLMAENKTIIIAESDLPYSEQTWFSSGNSTLQEDKIKKHWDEGRRITSIAFTANGWFVTMAKNTSYTTQTYKLSSQWPKDWITQKKNDGFYITSCAYDGSQWVVVMSKGTGYTSQTWNRNTWSELKPWIKEKWDNGYRITETAFNGYYWTIVMSKTDKIDGQGYLWATNDLKTKIKNDVWDKDYNVQLINYAEGSYFVVYCKYSKNNNRAQNYVIQTSDLKKYIKERWDNSQDIAYIGGGEPSIKSNTTSNSTYNNNQKNSNTPYRQDLPSGGYIEYSTSADGRMMMKTVMPCTMCHGSSVCTACWGQGGRWGAAYGGTWYPCVLCAGTGKNCCRVCNGKGKITTIAFSDGNGNAYGVSSNGSTSQSNAAGTIVSTPYGTKVYPNGGNSSSSTSSPSKSSSSENDYIEEIVYAPDYTGDSAPVWCEKCKKYGPRHSHIKKRVY